MPADILSPAWGEVTALVSEVPDCFGDLNLDQVIDAITAGREEYDLKPFYYAPLTDIEVVRYRQEVARDLQDATLFGCIETFAERMRTLRRYQVLADKLRYRYHHHGWVVEAAGVYCDAVAGLCQDLAKAALSSRGLSAFRDYLTAYAASSEFTALAQDTRAVRDALSNVRYCLTIKDGTVRVRRYDGEEDYSVEVRETFAKFRQGEVRDYAAPLVGGAGISHVEARILGYVARLFPDEFAALDAFWEAHDRFVDETIADFDRHVQFYMAYLAYVSPLQEAGLRLCYPEVCTTDKHVYADGAFDLALAHLRVSEGRSVVCNGFQLDGAERVIVVTGPNQGGKTTFARMFGQLHYLASLGLPVPGTRARLFLADQLLTHFEREEDIRSLRGKLEDDLHRIQGILSRATGESVIVLNEIFASTTLEDAVFLSREIMERILQLDMLGVWVTFIDELASMSDKTVSMVSTVVPDDPAIRTFRIVRRPADGLAYAMSIVERHHLTYAQIKERLIK